MSLTFNASAPANIALIKYMGKTAGGGNFPANPSLSFSLKNLRTFVSLEPSGEDGWAPLRGMPTLALTERGRQRYLGHLERCRAEWGFTQKFAVRSANDFPADCGLASSASSFAALTEAVYEFARAERGVSATVAERSALSRRGSGSSCRSFFEPWAIWRSEAAEPVPGLAFAPAHAVVLVDDGAKTVSSSDAHERVLSSPRFAGRADRAAARLGELLRALAGSEAEPARPIAWRRAFEICRDEYVDMHELFETSDPPFSYRTEGSRAVVAALEAVWLGEGDGPLVTMDAGPNVHVLFRPDQTARAAAWLKDFRVLKDWVGT